MKICAIQIPYGHTASDADKSVDFLIRELNNCDSSVDLILTPEYSNTPASFHPVTIKKSVNKSSQKLIEDARNTAVRCQIAVAINYLFEISDCIFRNTTKVFDKNGNTAGNFYKYHLPCSEINSV